MKNAAKKAVMGRPPLAGEPMIQVAIRFPRELLLEVDKIVDERFGQAERNSVIRELVAEALARRQGR